MSKIIYTINYLVRALGLFGITASLAFALVAAPAAEAAGASGSGTLPAPSTGGELVIAAFNRANGMPIAGASVVVLNPAGAVVASGTTPATGRLTFTLATGNYKVIAKAPGYTIGGEAVKVIAGQIVGLKVGLSPLLTGPTRPASN